MISIITGLAGTKYGKYLLEAVVVLGLVLAAYKWAEHKGASAQRDRDEQSQKQEIEKSRQEASAAKDKLVEVAMKKADDSERSANEARQQFAALAGAMSQLKERSDAGRSQVNRLDDSQLHGDIVSKLGIRAANDQAPGYYPKEERAIDDAVTQYPIVSEENKTLQDEVAKKSDEARSNLDTAAARKQAFDADEAYILRLEKYYQDVYNMRPPKYRSGKCLWLWNCGQRKIQLDPPRRGQ